jgi:Gas vesicle synthesis protein GvpL/GvpF
VTPSGEVVGLGQEATVPGAAPTVYVYGIVQTGETAQVSMSLAGLDECEITFVKYEDLAAAVSPIAVHRPLGRRGDLVAHSQALDALAARGAVIPVRFGSVMASEAAVVQELLAPNAERFGRILDGLVQRAQFNLRARYDEAAVLTEIVSAEPEIAELRERTRAASEEELYADRVRLGELVARALEVKRAYDGQVLLDVLAPHSAGYHVREASGLDHLLDVAFLVDVSRRADFEAAAEEIAAVMAERARLKLVGPVAPYDFVAEE